MPSMDAVKPATTDDAAAETVVEMDMLESPLVLDAAVEDEIEKIVKCLEEIARILANPDSIIVSNIFCLPLDHVNNKVDRPFLWEEVGLTSVVSCQALIGRITSAICPHCGSGEEMAKHLLLSCLRWAAECQHYFGDSIDIEDVFQDYVMNSSSLGHLPPHVGTA